MATIVPGDQPGRVRPDAAPAALPARLAVAWNRAEGLVTDLTEAAYGPGGASPPLDWRAWGPQVARALLEVLGGLDVMLPQARPMARRRWDTAPADPGLLAGLTSSEACELALRLSLAQVTVNAMPAGAPAGYQQILAEIDDLREQAMEQAGAAWRAFTAPGEPTARPGPDPAAGTAAGRPERAGPGL